MNPISVVLVEDHDLTRFGIRTVLRQDGEVDVVGEARNAVDGLKLLQTKQPDVAVVDVGLPGMDGIELIQRYKSSHPQAKVLMLTLQDDEKTVLAAFAAGADSYCLKDDIKLNNLLEALRVTSQGQSWIDPAIAKIVLQHVRQGRPRSEISIATKTIAIGAAGADYNQIIETYPLTERELEVLELIVDGHSNEEIAGKLYITVGTVKTHVRNILNKLCADDRTQAAVLALRAGLIS